MLSSFVDGMTDAVFRARLARTGAITESVDEERPCAGCTRLPRPSAAGTDRRWRTGGTWGLCRHGSRHSPHTPACPAPLRRTLPACGPHLRTRRVARGAAKVSRRPAGTELPAAGQGHGSCTGGASKVAGRYMASGKNARPFARPPRGIAARLISRWRDYHPETLVPGNSAAGGCQKNGPETGFILMSATPAAAGRSRPYAEFIPSPPGRARPPSPAAHRLVADDRSDDRGTF